MHIARLTFPIAYQHQMFVRLVLNSVNDYHFIDGSAYSTQIPFALIEVVLVKSMSDCSTLVDCIDDGVALSGHEVGKADDLVVLGHLLDEVLGVRPQTNHTLSPLLWLFVVTDEYSHEVDH